MGWGGVEGGGGVAAACKDTDTERGREGHAVCCERGGTVEEESEKKS